MVLPPARKVRSTAKRKGSKHDLVCPECGATGLSNSAALGSHRRKAHGTLGMSASAISRRNKTVTKTASESPGEWKRRRTVVNSKLSFGRTVNALSELITSQHLLRAARFEYSVRDIKELIALGHALAENDFNVNVYAGAKEFLAFPANNNPVVEISVKVDSKL